MSYILDALKKLEHDKLKKSRMSGMTSITGELFSNDQRPSDDGGMWKKIALLTVAVLIITLGATWYVLKQGKPAGTHRPTATARSSAPTPGPAPAPMPAPAPVVSAPVQPQPPLPATPAQDSEVRADAHKKVSATRPQPPAPAKPVAAPNAATLRQKPVAAKPAPVSAEDAASLITVQELRKRMKEQRGTSAPAIAPPADIKLSGIAWQEDRRARRAVINGFLMQEGGVVLGARITEILQDRVRFSQSGGVFEISLTAVAGTPPVGK